MERPKKAGRPFLEKKRDKRIEVKLNSDEFSRMDYCAKETETSRAAVIRRGIDTVYDEITKSN